MATLHQSSRDCVLFPRDQIFTDHETYQHINQSFGGLDRLSIDMDPPPPHFALPDRTTYDSYTTTYFEAPNPPFHPSVKGTETLHPSRPTPSASPSSMSQTYDQPSSILSSRSGASGQSTSSSVEGSPYIHGNQQAQFQDKWTDSYGLGINPPGANNDLFSSDAARALQGHSDISLDASRFPDYVGEYRENISTFVPVNEAFSSSNIFTSTPQEFPMLSSSPIEPPPRGVKKEDVTIDTIIEEFAQRRDRAAASTTTVSAPRAVGSAASSPRRAPTMSPLEAAPFRSPSAPAPATFPARRPSPFGHGAVHARPDAIDRVLRSPSASPTVSHHRQNLFFTQSSGRFVAPLQSSCRFPLTLCFLPLFPLCAILVS